ncbi:CerR family C-terminal domain-containing protein [Chelativorans sp.]|uniref:CerR family C-terminal domain-containing protein n=1 Tax=Chelativorans sp. TaxID=2203393 RepID=UPI002811E839|nr:CerR family C-terminal domain-containing protein [Chelativorans sp.]
MPQQKRAGGPQNREGKRGDPRDKLLTVAIDVFGRYGFEGATTRVLADTAGVNLQAIPYYFGGKEGLYIAAAEHIAGMISSHVAELRETVRGRLEAAEREGSELNAAEARALLTEILQKMAEIFVSPQSAPWARFLIREQMEPTEAFQRVYGGVMQPTLEVATRLVGILLAEPAGSEHVKLRTIALLGSLMVFRMAQAAAQAYLGWPQFGDRETVEIRSLAAELVGLLHPRDVS